jgi:hypothetical protein
MIAAMLLLLIGSAGVYITSLHLTSVFRPDYPGYDALAIGVASTVFALGASLIFALDRIVEEIKRSSS